MASLAEDMKALAEDILSTAKDRCDVVAGIQTQTRGFLADAEADRLDAFHEMHDRIAGRLHDIATQTDKLLNVSAAERRDMAKQLRNMAEDLRKQLADGESEHLETFRQIYNRIVARIAELVDDVRETKRDVRLMLGTLRSDIKAAREAWQGLARARADLAASTTQAKRASSPKAREKQP